MTYQEALDYLFTATPVYQHIGGAAYKPGLATMQALDAYYGSPHRQYKTIHVGGTNGKGSTSHTLAAILQSAGYRVGLFTSPHLLDFRERIRVDGEKITEDYVCHFTEGARELVGEYQPSFFELTSMMAMCYFAEMEVDVAVIEVGLGGRLDSTNIIKPVCSVITNISLDHTQYLGTTLEEIAREKAGIIKPHTPVVIGQAESEAVAEVFRQRAEELGAPILFADRAKLLTRVEAREDAYLYTTTYGLVRGELRGEAQIENTKTILAALSYLSADFSITAEAVRKGFAEVVELTGLMGRWQRLAERPLLICDTAHNEAGIALVLQQIAGLSKRHKAIRIVLGMARDKDVSAVLSLFPQDYVYYFTEASVSRALPCGELAELAGGLGLSGAVCPTGAEALSRALNESAPEDFIFVGGSNFVVADLLQHYPAKQ